MKKGLDTFLPKIICNFLETLKIDTDKLQEIRMNIGQPLIFKVAGVEQIPDKEGRRTFEKEEMFLVTDEILRNTFEFICRHSVYAYEEEIRQGFLTIEGGHRVGLVGQAVLEEGKVKNLKHISGLNIRLASEVKGCAKKVIPFMEKENGIYNTLIISPPCSGKTTLLRDCIRMLSDGNQNRKGLRVGVVDERGEIGACFHGIPQNDLGVRTDVLDRIPKSEGILMLIRSMSPNVIAVDEIGSASDMEALNNAALSGCSIIATIHGISPMDICEKPLFKYLNQNNMFQRYIVLEPGKMGEVKGIYDEEFHKIS